MIRLAKVTRPRLQQILPRRRLFRLLDSARERRVVWVQGAPGAGKTSLVASYVDDRKLNCLWYQFDAGDHDPASFFHHLGLAAAQVSGPGPRKPALHLGPEYLAGLPAFARRYMRDLCLRLRPPFALVFDDYHELPRSSVLHALLAESLCEIPEGGTAVVIDRAPPPAELARLRANGLLAVVPGEALRLTASEGAGIARLRCGGSRAIRVRELVELTEGWAAGFVVLLERQAGEVPRRQNVAESLPRLFDYFASEIFAKTDAETRRLLLETALLPRITGHMAERITGSGAAGRLLSDLARRGYFVLRLDGSEPEFQYHRLFREFLLVQGRASLSEGRRTDVRRAAARLLEEAGRAEEALELLSEVEGWDAMIRILVREAPRLLKTGRHATLARWAAQVPRELRREQPWFSCWLGLATLPSDPARGRDHLVEAYDVFQASGDAAGGYLAWIGVVDSYLYEWDDYAPLDHWIEEFAALRLRWPEFPSLEIEERATAAFFTALMYRRPDHPDFERWEERARAVALGGSNLSLRMDVGHRLLFLYGWYLGDMGRAQAVVDALRPLAAAADVDPLTAILWHCLEANHHWMRGRGQACLDAVAKGMAISRESGVRLWDFMLLAQGAFGAYAADDVAGMGEFLDRMAGAFDPSRRLILALHHHTRFILDLRRGEAGAALEHARTMRALCHEVGMPYGEAYACLDEGMALLEQGKDDEGLTRLAAAERLASFPYLRLTSCVTRLRHAMRRDERLAPPILREMLAMSRTMGFPTADAWGPAHLGEVLALALELGIEVESVREIVRDRRIPAVARALDLPNWPWACRLGTLGNFEVLLEDVPLRTTRKGQRRPLELLRLLVALGERAVPEEVVSAVLWPEAEGDKAKHALEMGVHRLRRILGSQEAVEVRDGTLRLRADLCWVDAWAFERLADRAIAALPRTHAGEIEHAVALARRALALHRGPFLPGRDEPPFAAYRRRLEGRRQRMIEALQRRGVASELDSKVELPAASGGAKGSR